MNYNSVISQLRVIARDMLRLQKTNKLRAERLVHSSALEDARSYTANSIKRLELNIARNAYNVSKLEEANPDREALDATFAEATANYEKEITALKENLVKVEESFTKQLAEVDEAIAKVQSGEFKVGQEALTCLTDELVANYTNGRLAGVDAEAPGADVS